MILLNYNLNIVAKYQRDEVVICLNLFVFVALMYYGLLLSGGLRQFDDIFETKFDLKFGFLDDKTRGDHFYVRTVRLIFLFKYEPETSDY